MKIYPATRFLFFLIVQVLWNSAGATTIICGTIKDSDRAHEIEISNTIDHFFGHGTTPAFTLDDSGYFKFEMDIRQPKFVLLMYKNGLKRIFVHPNDSLYAKLEVKDSLLRITFSGDGSGENNFLNLFDHSYEEISHREDLNIFLQKSEDQKKARINYINESQDKFELSEAFIKILKYDVKYSNLVGLSLFLRRDDIDQHIKADLYEKIMLPENIANEAALTSLAYHDYLYHYQVYYRLKFLNEGEKLLKNEQKSLLEAREIIIYNAFEGKTLEVALVSLMLQAIRYNEGKAIVNRFYENFKTRFPNSKYVDLISQKLKEGYSTKTYEKDKIITSSGIVDSSNLSFDELIEPYKGKVIYIDFWATWCAPCLAEFRHISDLKEQFQDNDEVVFMYISLDEKSKIDKWKKFIDRYHLEGINRLLPGGARSQIAKQLNIEGIPRYIIVDKNGTIALAHALRPSNKRRLYAQIRSFL